jgi:hypothetical protein
MWRAMKVLQKRLRLHEVAQAASQDGFVVKPTRRATSPRSRAPATSTLREAKPGTPARYRLAKNTGPHAPAITRRKCVFDRNTGAFAELQTAQEVCDGIDE